MIVATFTNPEEQMQAQVDQIGANKFQVSLIDLESQNTLPITYTGDSLDWAIAKAKHLACTE